MTKFIYFLANRSPKYRESCMLSLNSLVYQTVAENKTKYSRCLHFSIQNMEQSRDLIRALDGLTLTSTDAWYDVLVDITESD